MPALEVDDLSITYGTIRAVDGVSFSAEAGRVLALLGPNGAGKTSTVEALEGYRRPTSGQVRVLGLDPVSNHAAVTPRIGVMLQDGGVYPGIRPLEMLRLLADLYPDADDPEALLERVGLGHRRRSTWRHLSGGEQQRLSLALALVGRPDVVFLDEPSAGVDVSGRQLIRNLVRELATEGRCVLLTTHDLDEAEKVADDVVIIDRGRVVAQGSPSELMTSGRSAEIRFGAPAGLDVAGLGATLRVLVVEESPGEYRVDAEPTPANVAALTGWLAERNLPLADLRAGRQRLEDVFLQLTASEAPHDDAEASGRRGRRARRRSRTT
jgi:ABC-2 type transport system ATP-binding protein